MSSPKLETNRYPEQTSHGRSPAISTPTASIDPNNSLNPRSALGTPPITAAVHSNTGRPDLNTQRSAGRIRTLSSIQLDYEKNSEGAKIAPQRRFSSDELNGPVEFEVYVDETYAALIEREDTDNNVQITVEDQGPKWINLGTLRSGGHSKKDIRTTYHLSNLLQELYLAKQKGLKRIVLSEERINENPVSRLARIIKDDFWGNLTRRIDGSNVAMVGRDPKDWTDKPRPRIYVPQGAPEQYDYYQRIARENPSVNLDVQWLDSDPSDPHYVRDLNTAPGLLALEMERIADTPKGEPDFRGLPFVVPGGRFNELYGWDSYMESLGLIINEKTDLARNMVRHFCFSIRHYGKILNANRSYYLSRSQPPFLTDMSYRVFDKLKQDANKIKDENTRTQLENEADEFLRIAVLAAIKEYYEVWVAVPRLDEETGLSRYRPQGVGVPPETEASHFKHILTPYAEKHNMTYAEFIAAYNYNKVHEPELDNFFLHDRAVRESGHDTSYRLEYVAADLATVDLNSCLYKYETDIAHIISTEFGGTLKVPAEYCAKGRRANYLERAQSWTERAAHRRHLMNKYMWDESKGMYFDYNTIQKQQTGYESATTFWAMWAGVASPAQATVMVRCALPKFEVGGGLVSGTEASRGVTSLSRPNRQWDYPYGWAPQQILAWHGMLRYGYQKEAQRLVYRWLFMVTKAFVDFNGVVVEKYNVTDPKRPHIVSAEYGNQGSDFKGRATEGFGWVNASYIIGLDILDEAMKRRLGALASWDEYREKKMPEHQFSISRQEPLGSPEKTKKPPLPLSSPSGDTIEIPFHKSVRRESESNYKPTR